MLLHACREQINNNRIDGEGRIMCDSFRLGSVI